jgi:hypothetical protein
MAKAGEFGRMAAIHGTQMTSVPLEEAVKVKQVDLGMIEIAKRFFT